MESINIDTVNTNMKVDKISLMKHREVERQQNLQKKKDEYNLHSADNEKLDFFHAVFSERHMYISNLLNKAPCLSKEQLPEHLNEISKEIIKLQKYVAASNFFLRHYDLQKCQAVINELSSTAKSLDDELLPKKKFSFKNKMKQAHVNQNNNKSSAKDVVDYASKYKIEEGICGYFNRVSEFLQLEAGEIFQKDVTLSNLENCTVYLKGSPSTLHLHHLKGCKILSGPVSTSIFGENCEDSTFVIACQQLRMHTSKNINMYLHVTSRGILEDCTGIGVASYNWNYHGIEKDFEKANLNISINNWKSLDDFNWLHETHSPNWKEIKEEDQIKDWNMILS